MTARQLSDADTDGTIIGQNAADLVAFYGATPIAQRTNSAGAAVTSTVGSAVAGTASTSTTPFGFAQVQADAIVTNVNALRVDVLATVALANELRAAIVALGLHKGS